MTRMWPTLGWSSEAAHCGLCKDLLLDGAFSEPDAVEDWSHWLLEEERNS